MAQVAHTGDAQGLRTKNAVAKLCMLSLSLGLEFSDDIRFDATLRAVVLEPDASEAERLEEGKTILEIGNPLAPGLCCVAALIAGDSKSTAPKRCALRPP